MTRRQLLERLLLGTQVLALAACGGDDDDEAEAPRAAPTAPQASEPRVAREPVMLRLAAVLDRHGTSVGDAIERWNAGEVPGAPEDVQLQRVKIGISVVVRAAGTHRTCASHIEGLPERTRVCRHTAGPAHGQHIL